VGQHSSALASRLLGLDGFEVLAAEVVGGEWELVVQTTATVVGCMGCGVRAKLHGRRTVRVRDLPTGGRPVALLWRKRIWRCCEPACRIRTWTERAATIRPRAVLTERTCAEACRRVGKDAYAVAQWRWTPGAGMPARWWRRWAMRPWSWTTSTSSGWPTRGSTRSAVGPSRPPSGIGAASAIRCTASVSCC
jgi:hypothetical protein